MEKENREHKDSVFVDLFYQDETAKKNLLSLYNALHDTNYKDETIIRKVKIDDVLYKNFKNDISCEVNGLVLVFGEHMSTINRNMPLRCLMYVGRAYEQLVDSKARYRTTLVKIPTPEFYVFYNGEKEQPLEQVLSLSDAFMNPAGENSVELKVENMLIAEYSYEEDIQVKQQEAMQQGIQKGIQKGIILSGKIFQMVKKNPNLANEQIALKLGCSVEEVENTRKMFVI